MTTPTNAAAWLEGSKVSPLEVKSAPFPIPGPNEIVIKNAAVAVNPVDWAMQAMGTDFFPWLTFPRIVGIDCAGTIISIGSSVTSFSIGDRVLGNAVSPNGGAFQSYVVLQTNVASKIPASMTFEQASVLPLCLSTAAYGLFQKDYLALEHPSLEPKPTGKTLVVWGGASGVGSNAIQLAVAAGYEVFTTCSPKNFHYVLELGASKTFDYNSPTVVAEIVHALEGKDLVGVLDIVGVRSGAFKPCCEILLAATGGKGGFVASAMHLPDAKEIPKGVETKFINAGALKDTELGRVVYEFLEKALEKGVYKAKPDPLVVGNGLEAIQGAMEKWRSGVSAQKVVVSLE